MQIASTVLATNVTKPQKTDHAVTADKGTAEPIDHDEIKIGSDSYDGKEIKVNGPAPLSHKVVAGIATAGAALCAAKVGMHVLSQPTIGGKVAAGAMAFGAGVAGLAAADLGSGVFHHFIDNYPKKPDLAKPGELTWNTPIIGDVAAEFQVHHHFTRDLETVPFVSNLYAGGRVLAPALLALGALSNSPAALAAGGAFLAGGFFAQGSHRWTHMPNPPAIAKFTQKVGLTQSKEDHHTHHKMPWSDNYCIVNGMWNPVLTRNDFWRKWEGAIYKLTGAEPNSWRDPGVKELALGEISKEEFLERRQEDKKTFLGKVKEADEREALRPYLYGRDDLTEYHAPT